MERKQFFLTVCYLALVATLLYLLFQARTPVARTIWATFDPSNLVVYLGMTFVLLVIVMFKGSYQITLSLIVVQSIVSNVFKQIVFASRFGYDTWISLGWSTYVFRGELYSLSKIPFMVYSSYSLFSKIYHVTERVNLYSVCVVLARMFSVDVYWVHLLLVPLLWGIFMPVLIYKVTKFFFKGEAVPLIAAALFSCINIGGTSTISYSLSWVFLLLVIYLSLSYMCFKRGLLLLIIVAFVTFLTHELIGMLSASVILLAYAYTKITDFKHKNVQWAFLLMAFVLAVLSIPYALLAFGWMQAGGPSFSLKPIEQLSADEAVMFFIFDTYADMTFRDALISGIIPLLGLLGLVYTILERGEEKQNRRASVFVLLCIILAMIDYRIMRLFMVNLPGKVDFSLSLRVLLAIPFAAIAISRTMNFVSHKLASGSNRKVTENTTLFKKMLNGGIVSVDFRKIAVVAIFILSISSLAILAVYSAYPQWTEAWWTTADELEAAKYIEENTPHNETYVVLCDVHARLAGYAVVGPENPRAYYYGPYESRFLEPLYQDMVDDPSMGPILDIREKNNALTVYVMINTIRTEVKDADRVIAQMMNLPHSELFGIFGEDVYVFKVTPPRERMIRGVGPPVLYNNQTYINTTFTVDIVTYEASYNLSLIGLTSYSITSWPMHWSFESVTPAPYSKNIDADNWINFTGREDVTYTVLWKTNLIYQPVGWKDDSFKTDEWQVSFSVHWEEKIPQISTDGDILTMTGIFQKEIREGYHITREVPDISTDEYPYVIVRWRSTGTCAGVAVEYESGLTQVLKPEVTWHYAQYSRDWKVSIVKLPEGKTVKAVRLALDDYPSWTDLEGTHSVYFDYIMFSNVTSPQF